MTPKADIEPVATLVERLRKAADHSGMILTDPPQPTALNALLSEAASALLALEGERDALREALEQIAGHPVDNEVLGRPARGIPGYASCQSIARAALSSSEHI
jgi:hypothetical protein